MITTGLIQELLYISQVLNTSICVEINCPEINVEKLSVRINKKVLSIHYQQKLIWRESLDENGFFGIESCDAISRIISCINQNNPVWEDYVMIEFILDEPAKDK